jgi:hypothetical protein
MPVRTVRVVLDGDYADFSLEMRSNPPVRIFTEMQDNTEFSALRDRLAELIVNWDFVDDHGDPIPVGQLDDVPVDMFGMIVTRYLDAINTLTSVPKV